MKRPVIVPEEWFIDPLMRQKSSDIRVLSLVLAFLADDNGRGSVRDEDIARLWDRHPSTVEPAICELSGWFLTVYSVGRESYYEIVNWNASQRVDEPRPSTIPPPGESRGTDPTLLPPAKPGKPSTIVHCPDKHWKVWKGDA